MGAGCVDERAAAEALGYNQTLWDNGGDAPSGAAYINDWTDMTATAQLAATQLGYSQTSWDDESEPQPASDDKYWADFTTCGACVSSKKKGARSMSSPLRYISFSLLRLRQTLTCMVLLSTRTGFNRFRCFILSSRHAHHPLPVCHFS